MRTARKGTFTVVCCFLASALLAILPLPDWLDLFRPSFPLLVVLFWAVALPDRYGSWSGWLLGVLLDVLRGTPLGMHALALALAGFAASRLSARMKIYPLPQQMLAVGVLAGMSVMVARMIGNMTDTTTAGLFTALLPVVTTAMLWPWASAFQDRLRRTANVS